MPPTGMVHALERIRNWLVADQGWLIDIHPRPIPRPLSVHIDRQDYRIEALVDELILANYQQADNALERAVDQRWYHPEAATPFSFDVYFDSVTDLIEYLLQDDTGIDREPAPVLDPAVIRRVEAHLQLPGSDKRIVLHRPVMLRRYTVVQGR